MRTKTQINLSKLRFSIDYDLQIANHSRQPSSHLKNIVLGVSEDKKTSKFPICEIKEMSLKDQYSKIPKLSHRTKKNNYFNRTIHQGNSLLIKNTSIKLVRDAEDKRNRSLRTIANDFWSSSPVKDFNLTTSNWKDNNYLKKSLVEHYQKVDEIKRKLNSVYSVTESNEKIQNCACIQTDDIEELIINQE